MVSVHNTINYHNHIYEFPEEKFIINNNTIYDYINKEHSNIIQNINNNRKLKDVLNSVGVKYTFFISINDNIDDLYDFLFRGEIIIDNDSELILDNLNHKRLIIENKQIDGNNIVITNIKLKNGILHILS
jgi:hypothetical protein